MYTVEWGALSLNTHLKAPFGAAGEDYKKVSQLTMTTFTNCPALAKYYSCMISTIALNFVNKLYCIISFSGTVALRKTLTFL